MSSAREGGGRICDDGLRPIARWGESGAPAIVAGQADESYLLDLISPVDGEAEMPRSGKPLTKQERTLITKWIVQGAKNDSGQSGPLYDQKHPPVYHQPVSITSLDDSPDGKLLAVAGHHEVTLHESVKGQRVARLIGMSPRIESIRFSPNGKLLTVTGGSPAESGEVQVWDTATRELKLSLPMSYDTIHGASWSPDSKLLAFGCADNSVKAINAVTGEIVFNLAANNDWVLDTVFSKDGTHLATVSRDKSAKLLDIGTQPSPASFCFWRAVPHISTRGI